MRTGGDAGTVSGTLSCLRTRPATVHPRGNVYFFVLAQEIMSGSDFSCDAVPADLVGSSVPFRRRCCCFQLALVERGGVEAQKTAMI